MLDQIGWHLCMGLLWKVLKVLFSRMTSSYSGFTFSGQTSLSVLFIVPNWLTYFHPCMPVIPLVPSDSPTLISSLRRLSAHHLALAALASQTLKSGTLSLYLSVPVPVLAPSVVISRPTTASRPSNPLNPSPLAPQIRLCWPLCAFVNYIYLLTYLLWCLQCFDAVGWAAGRASGL